jgi:UDP-N-acetylmuramate--alanine ligase
MSSLARLLVAKGYAVSGSDTGSNASLEALKDLGVTVYSEHQAHHVSSQAQVIYSTSIQASNPELIAAKEKKIPVLHRAELLNQLMQPQHPLLVAGAHGKTSTTAMLYHLLEHSGFNPSCSVGGILSLENTNAKLGAGKYFVAEADESDGSFLKMQRYGAIVTNVEKEHMDYWKTLPRLRQGYLEFISKVENKDLLFLCGEDPFLFNLGYEKHYYGFSPQHSLQIIDLKPLDQGSSFSLNFEGNIYGPFFLPLSGKHYVLNATAALGMALKLGVDPKALQEGLKNFQGVQRRLQELARLDKLVIYDDYAHHPTEVSATLEALGERLTPKQELVAVFQPHRFSRLADQFEEFCRCFSCATRCVITDVYGAGEAPIEGIDGQTLASYINHDNVCYQPKEDLVDFLKENLGSNALVVMMGAGDITQLAHELATHYRAL